MNAAREIHRSRVNKKASNELKNFVLSCTHMFLVKHYGVNYSDRCLQSSLGINRILRHFGFNSILLEGGFCMPRTSFERKELGWQGFWGEDHHYWILTEFKEIIDLSISLSAQHPAFKNNEPYSPPPIWWQEKRGVPDFMIYLSTQSYGLNGIFELQDPSDNLIMQHYLKDIEDFLNSSQLTYTSNFDYIFSDMSDFNSGLKRKDPWFLNCSFHSSIDLPIPKWFEDRMKTF